MPAKCLFSESICALFILLHVSAVYGYLLIVFTIKIQNVNENSYSLLIW